MSASPHYTRTIWGNPPEGRLMGPGHPVGDFLDGPEWRVLDEQPGFFRVEARLVDAVKNYRGHLFGGFAPTYVDLIALRTVSAGQSLDKPHGWLLTVNMRLDYFEPVEGPTFVIESRIKNRRGRTLLVETSFFKEDTMLLHALTTLREQPAEGAGG
jgi:acyl-coenzyme A thioesterase PaaI-like protein